MVDKIRGSYWFKSGSFSLLSQFSNVFFGFINFYFLLRILDKNEFGVWTLFISVAGFMEIVKNGFITSPLVRYSVARGGTEYTEILSASLVLNCLVTAIQILVIILFSIVLSDVWNSPELENLFYIFIVASLLLIPATHFNALLQAQMNFKGTLYSNVTRQFVLFVFVFVGFLTNLRIELWQLAVVHSLSIFFSVIVGYFNVQSYLDFSRKISKKWLKDLAIYGQYTFGTNISSTVLRNVDTWMLGAILSPAAVTIYNPAIRIANIVEVPTVSLSQIFFPKLLSRFAEKGNEAAKDMYEKSVGALFAVMFPITIGCLLLAGPIVFIVAGEGFEETVNILRITIITALIIPFNRQVGITLDAIGKARINFYFVLRNAAINVVLSYFLIHQFGIIGAAYSMLITFIFSFLYNQYYIHQLLDVNVLAVFKYAIFYYRTSIAMVFDYISPKRDNE